MERRGNEVAGRIVLERLEGLAVGEGTSHAGMVVFPVFSNGGEGKGGQALDYRTLDEAVREGWVEVTEQPTATVPELVLRNAGKTMVLVIDGEEIVGGKQNRIVNAAFLVAAGSKVILPVTCVEHGRWHEVSANFVPGEVTFFSLKREKHEQVRASLHRTGRPVADQGAVWDHLAERHMAARTESPTGAMRDLYSRGEEALLGYESAFPYVSGAIGLIVALGGRMAGADLFDQPRTASVLWHKLVRSYALDALQGKPGSGVDHSRALRFLARARDARIEVFPSLALGEDVRLQGDGLVGSALVYQDTPVYVNLFRIHRGAADRGGRMARSSLRRRFERGHA